MVVKKKKIDPTARKIILKIKNKKKLIFFFRKFPFSIISCKITIYFPVRMRKFLSLLMRSG